MTPLKLVILDRDGTINEDRDDYVKSPDEWVPLPGLFHLIGERFGIDLAEVPLVGDSLRDLQAGSAAGCPTHLVRTGKAAELDEAGIEWICRQVPGTRVHADLAAFAEHLIQRERALRGAAGKDDSGFGRLE